MNRSRQALHFFATKIQNPSSSRGDIAHQVKCVFFFKKKPHPSYVSHRPLRSTVSAVAEKHENPKIRGLFYFIYCAAGAILRTAQNRSEPRVSREGVPAVLN